MKAYYPKYLKTDPSVMGLKIKEIFIIAIVLNLLIVVGIQVKFAIFINIVGFILFKIFKSKIEILSIVLKKFSLKRIDLSSLFKERK